MTSFDKRFTNEDIRDVREVTRSEGASCRDTLELQDKKYRAKTITEGNLTEAGKVKKETGH